MGFFGDPQSAIPIPGIGVGNFSGTAVLRQQHFKPKKILRLGCLRQIFSRQIGLNQIFLR